MKFLLIVLFAAAVSGLAPLHTQKDKIQGSYIVAFKNNVNVKDAVATIKSLPLFSTLGGQINREYTNVLKGVAATLSTKALDLVRRLDIVEYVEEDQVMYASELWGLDRVDQRSLPLNNNYSPKGTGSGISVYILDTGINAGHNEFGSRAYTDFTMDFHSTPNNGVDCHGHGTHCAGTIGGSSYGVAKSVSLYGVRVLGCFGSGTNSGITSGMDFVAARSGRRVASMSLGGGASLTTDNAVGRLYDAGVPVIVAAGNENQDACDVSPARASKAYTIGATDSSDSIASFSNWGTCVDLFAPGVDIQSATHSNNFGSTVMSGTSMACPHVAGGATLECGSLNCTPSSVYASLSSNASSNKISGLTFSKSSSPNLLLYTA